MGIKNGIITEKTTNEELELTAIRQETPHSCALPSQTTRQITAETETKNKRRETWTQFYTKTKQSEV